MRVWEALVEVAFPSWCPGCGCRASPVCAQCAATLRPAFPAPPPAGVDQWFAPFRYEGVARELIARLKYRQARAATPWLASYMARAVIETRSLLERGVVTFAPTTVARRRARGFDHAEILAASFAAQLGLPMRAMLRRRPGPPQTGQPAALRRLGPRFESRAGAVARVVLLVDDVATTGATLAAAATALHANGTATVLAVTGARTPPPGTARIDGAYTRSMAAGDRR